MKIRQRRDIRPTVFAALEELGRATAIQIHQAAWRSGVTLRQVQSCIYNCQSEGHLVVAGRVPRKPGQPGPTEALYQLAGSALPILAKSRQDDAPSYRGQFASVFHYAQAVGESGRKAA